MALTHWKKLSNPDYIGSYAFQPGETKTLTVSRVTRDEIIGADGKKEQCTIVHWRENEKPMILNSTNGKMISKVLNDPYVENWAGKRIVLGVEKVKAFGEVVEAVRVKKVSPVQEADTPSEIICADCGKPVAATGKHTATQIATAAKNRYGVELCMECATARKEVTAPEEGKEPADENHQD